MDDLITLLVAFVYWRIVVSTLVACAVALLLNNLVPAFTAGHGLSLVVTAIVFGIYWQGRAEAGLSITERMEEPVISRPVAFLGLALIGALWGGGFAYLLRSALAGGLALCCAVALVALWRHIVQRQSTRANAIAFALFSLLMGYVSLQLPSLIQKT